MVKRVSVLALVAIMLFSFVMFGASNCEMYNPQVTELLRRVEEMEQRLRDKADRIEELEEEIRLLKLELRKVSAVSELEDFVDDLDWRSNDSRHILTWAIPRYIEDGIKAINAAEYKEDIEYALALAKHNINEALRWEWEYSECGRFVFGINVIVFYGLTAPYTNTELFIFTKLKNVSDKTYIVAFGGEIGLSVIRLEEYPSMPISDWWLPFRFISANEQSMNNISNAFPHWRRPWASNFPSGRTFINSCNYNDFDGQGVVKCPTVNQIRLQYRVRFYINFDEYSYMHHGQHNGELIEIYSSLVTLNFN